MAVHPALGRIEGIGELGDANRRTALGQVFQRAERQEDLSVAAQFYEHCGARPAIRHMLRLPQQIHAIAVNIATRRSSPP
jgi:hypothetical protein